MDNDLQGHPADELERAPQEKRVRCRGAGSKASAESTCKRYGRPRLRTRTRLEHWNTETFELERSTGATLDRRIWRRAIASAPVRSTTRAHVNVQSSRNEGCFGLGATGCAGAGGGGVCVRTRWRFVGCAG